MSKTIEEQMIFLKESFDSVGTKLNRLTWQRIEKSHLDFIKSQTQELQEQNREIVESNESLTSKLKEAKSMIGRLRRSMSVHPDCTSGSEFDDYITDAQNLEDEIEELLTKNNHLKSNTNG